MKLSILKNERGLTLIEILVAFLILTMALVTMMNSFAMGSRINADTSRYNTALALAQSKMEEIKNTTFNSVVNAALTNFSTENDYSQFVGYSYTIAVENDGLNNKMVTVTVSYSDEGVPKSLAISAEVTKR